MQGLRVSCLPRGPQDLDQCRDVVGLAQLVLMAGWVPGQRVWAWRGLEEGVDTCWTHSSCPSSGSLKWLPPCLEPAGPVGPPGGSGAGALAPASARERGPSGPGGGGVSGHCCPQGSFCNV